MAFNYGPVEYNGITFDTGLKVTCRMETVYTRSERKVKYVKYSITVDGIVSADSCLDISQGAGQGGWNLATYTSTDGKLMTMREALLREGGVLYLANVGLGKDLLVYGASNEQNLVNAQRQVRHDDEPVLLRADVNFGPKPRILDWEPIGATKSCRVRWTCDFYLATCVNALSDITQFEYSLVWSLNSAGMCVRTITGIIEVANNIYTGVPPTTFCLAQGPAANCNPLVAGQGRALANQADKYREFLAVTFPLLDGFSRNQQYALDASKKQLLFTLSDHELDTGGNPYYPGVIEADLEYGTTNATEVVLNRWASTLSGTIRVKPGLTKKVAYAAFLVILAEKLKNIEGSMSFKKGLGQAYENGEVKEATPVGKNWLLYHFSVVEEVFGRGITVSVAWMYTTALEDLIGVARHFEKLDSTKRIELGNEELVVNQHDWTLWKQSIADVQDPRGFSELSYNRDTEMIVGMCDAYDQRSLGSDGAIERPEPDAEEPILSDSTPDPEASWMHFKNNMYWIEDPQTHHQIIIKKPKAEPAAPTKDEGKNKFRSSDASDPGGLIQLAEAEDTGEQVPIDGEPQYDPPNKVTFRRSDSSFSVRLIGQATRAGRPSPVPYLFDANGAPATLRSRKVNIDSSSRLNCPIWHTTWDLVYDIEGPPPGDVSRIGIGPEMFGHPLTEGVA